MLSFLSTSSQSASLETALLWNALEPAGGKAGPAGTAGPGENKPSPCSTKLRRFSVPGTCNNAGSFSLTTAIKDSRFCQGKKYFFYTVESFVLSQWKVCPVFDPWVG